MQINVKIEGADAVAEALMEKSEQMRKKIEKAIAQGCKMIGDDAKAKAPVDTGRLRESITSEASGLEGKVGTNVHYAMYQEFGTYKMAAHPFLVPALEANADAVAELIAQAVTN